MPETISQSLSISIFPLRLSFNLKVFWWLFALCFLSLLVISIVQFNAYTREVYLIKNYQAQIGQLTEESKVLEISFSQENSLKNINNYLANFEKANKIEYIQVLESQVAAKPR